MIIDLDADIEKSSSTTTHLDSSLVIPLQRTGSLEPDRSTSVQKGKESKEAELRNSPHKGKGKR